MLVAVVVVDIVVVRGEQVELVVAVLVEESQLVLTAQQILVVAVVELVLLVQIFRVAVADQVSLSFAT
jgi:hypothetical protein